MKNGKTPWFYQSAFFILHSPWLFQIVAAINDAGVEEGRWASRTTLTRLRHPLPLPRARDIGRARHSVRAVVGLRGGGQGIARPVCRRSFRAGNLFCHAASVRRKSGSVNSAFAFPQVQTSCRYLAMTHKAGAKDQCHPARAFSLGWRTRLQLREDV